MRPPMTLCLTFDDGFMVHHDIAAPMLEERGWRGTFNVPTEFMNPNHDPLTISQLKDCCLDEEDGRLMSWDDVRDLVHRGHEVYPHTLGHVDLQQLERAGLIGEMRRQVTESRRQFVQELGFAPKFFCSPHNSWSQTIIEIVRASGMELLNCNRRNFPTDPSRKPSTLSVFEYVREEWRRGFSHLDVMIHGIVRAHGGWEPFETVESFGAFLDELKELERSRYVRVVPYSSAHVCPGHLLRGRLLARRVTNKLKRWIYSL